MAEIKEVKDLNTIAGIRRATQESIRPVIEEYFLKYSEFSVRWRGSVSRTSNWQPKPSTCLISKKDWCEASRQRVICSPNCCKCAKNAKIWYLKTHPVTAAG